MKFKKGDFVQDKVGNKYIVMETDNSLRPYKLCCIFLAEDVYDSVGEPVIEYVGDYYWVCSNNDVTDLNVDSLTKIMMPWDETDPVALLPLANEVRKQLLDEAVALVTESINSAVADSKFEAMVEFKNTDGIPMVIKVLEGKGYICTVEGKQLLVSWKE